MAIWHTRKRGFRYTANTSSMDPEEALWSCGDELKREVDAWCHQMQLTRLEPMWGRRGAVGWVVHVFSNHGCQGRGKRRRAAGRHVAGVSKLSWPWPRPRVERRTFRTSKYHTNFVKISSSKDLSSFRRSWQPLLSSELKRVGMDSFLPSCSLPCNGVTEYHTNYVGFDRPCIIDIITERSLFLISCVSQYSIRQVTEDIFV